MTIHDEEFGTLDIGDADPTSSDMPISKLCAELGPGQPHYTCTRWNNHDGPHVAGDGREVCDYWYDPE